jgi:ethanolamine utilization protein EutN
MRLGTVIGRVTMTPQEPVYKGGRLLLVQPLAPADFAAFSNPAHKPQSPKLTVAPALVAYDRLGAAPGHIVGFTEGAEAAAPFTTAASVDAYIACIVEQIHYQPPQI